MTQRRKRTVAPPPAPRLTVRPVSRLRHCLHLAVAVGIAAFVLRGLFDFLVSYGLLNETDAAGLFMLSLPVALATIISVMPFGGR